MRTDTTRVCDRCGNLADSANDPMLEFHEFVCIDLDFGYGATELDGDCYEIDLCLACVKEVLLPHARFTGSSI